MASHSDTIFALSSGRLPAAIAVVRISGPRAGDALAALTGKLPEPRQARLARVRDPGSGEIIDEALVLWFPAPNSETGEHVAELQLHGGRAVVAAVHAALGRLEGLRPADAGEFTRRAFENGRLDLTAVEGLADLIQAETEAQRRQAYRQLKGLLGDRAETWRGRLTEALALIEARIDFADEADVPEELVGPALEIARSIHAEMAEALAAAGRGERLRDGLVVAIAGPPNAGKSTLLNRLARRDAAIVSSVPGTTRDVIEVHMDLGGYPVTLLDTAGIRESADPVEQEGIRRARERASAADLVLWLDDETGSAVTDSYVYNSANMWMIHTKSDIREIVQLGRYEHEFIVSSLSGQGVNKIIDSLTAFAETRLGREPALVSRARHRQALADATEALRRALNLPAEGREDILAEELRAAAQSLGRLTGRIGVEDVLDAIFRDFCIGK